PPLGLAQQDLATSAVWWLAAILTLMTGFDYVTSARRRPRPDEMTQRSKVAGIVGWHNSGKTTLVVALVRELNARGYRISTVKHAHHKFDVDTPGKDSWQHRDAGAAEVMVGSEHRWALMHELRGAPEPDLDTLLSHMSPVDLILVEGFKSAEIDKIEVYRDGLDEPAIALTNDRVVAVACATQIENLDPAVMQLDPDDVGALADFIEHHWSLADTRRPTQAEKL
ncbi:MAG: molybdopterin-guanine dinucleotide biosynthesis protein B, partial [Alphaproteobacteria bacterium]